MKTALKLNKKDSKFLIWGTCLGYEAIVYSMSNYKIKTTDVGTLNQSRQIKWLWPFYKQSLFPDMLRMRVARNMEKQKLAYFSHHWGFEVSEFMRVPELRQNFNVIAYYQKGDKRIVAAVQHKEYPIIATQFHPEKILFEHKAKINVKLTKTSMMFSQELSRVFFIAGLENKNQFKNQRILDILEFKNFSTKKTLGVFETVYCFKKAYFKEKNLRKAKDTLNKVN